MILQLLFSELSPQHDYHDTPLPVTPVFDFIVMQHTKDFYLFLVSFMDLRLNITYCSCIVSIGEKSYVGIKYWLGKTQLIERTFEEFTKRNKY